MSGAARSPGRAGITTAMAEIRLLLGFGNPGLEYERTRHNAGFWFMDALAAQLGARFLRESKLHSEVAKAELSGVKVLLAKPQTFMNRSGLAVVALSQYYKIPADGVLIAHDELDLPAGTARLKFDGGHGGQNGLRDTIAHLGHGQFHRLRIGIGHPGHKDQVTPWVLGRPSMDQEKQIRSAIDRALQVLPAVVSGDLNTAMKDLHTASK